MAQDPINRATMGRKGSAPSLVVCAGTAEREMHLPSIDPETYYTGWQEGETPPSLSHRWRGDRCPRSSPNRAGSSEPSFEGFP